VAVAAPAVGTLGAVAQTFEALTGMALFCAEPSCTEPSAPEPRFVTPGAAARVSGALVSATPTPTRTSVAPAFSSPGAGAGRVAVARAPMPSPTIAGPMVVCRAFPASAAVAGAGCVAVVAAPPPGVTASAAVPSALPALGVSVAVPSALPALGVSAAVFPVLPGAVVVPASVRPVSAAPAVVASAAGTSFPVAVAPVAPVLTAPVLAVDAFRAPNAVALSGLGADIALLSGVTRIQVFADGAPGVVGPPAEGPAVVEPDRWGPTVVDSGATEPDGAAVPVGGGQPGEASGTVASDGLGAGGLVSAVRGPGRVLVACGVSRFVMVVPPRCAGVPNALRRCAGYARYRGRQTELGGMSLERGSREGSARGGGFRRTASAAMIGASIVNPR
jgi:hypothetical protein